MKNMSIISVLILFLSTSFLHAQELNKLEEKEAIETFELFFDLMGKRDTVALKSIIHSPHSTRWFFETFSGNDQQLKGSSASTVGGFLKSNAVEDGLVGKCRNKFDNITVQLYHRYAIITANYQCFVSSDEPENQGLYSVQLLKSNRWKIESVKRYIKTENEYFPKSEYQNGEFKCPAINLSFDLPTNWEIISPEYMFKYGLPYPGIKTDSLFIKSKLLFGIRKSEEKILVYITEPKFEDKSVLEQIKQYRLVLKNKDQSMIRADSQIISENERLNLNNIDFIMTSEETEKQDGIVEKLTFDSIIDKHVITIVCILTEDKSKKEILSILETFRL